jgi:hypothetical protein
MSSCHIGRESFTSSSQPFSNPSGEQPNLECMAHTPAPPRPDRSAASGGSLIDTALRRIAKVAVGGGAASLVAAAAVSVGLPATAGPGPVALPVSPGQASPAAVPARRPAVSRLPAQREGGRQPAATKVRAAAAASSGVRAPQRTTTRKPTRSSRVVPPPVRRPAVRPRPQPPAAAARPVAPVASTGGSGR